MKKQVGHTEFVIEFDFYYSAAINGSFLNYVIPMIMI